MQREELVPVVGDSALALTSVRLQSDMYEIHDPDHDSLLYVAAGSGSLTCHGERELEKGSAALVLAGESATIDAGPQGIELLHATVGLEADRHAALGPREVVVARYDEQLTQATGARSFRVLFGPCNGSIRATLFLGYVPPGQAPWHYHLYDEIVWVPDGPGRILRRGSDDVLEAGSAFRLRPREVHIVENSSADLEMTIVGIFTPAGSPAAAYLTDE